MLASLILKHRRERPLLRKHPWIFSGGVERIDGDPQPGDTIEVHDSTGKWIARAAYSPNSQIIARVWTFDVEEKIDRDFIRKRIEAAVAYRESLGLSKVTNAWRLVFGEADGLPGLVIDRYGDIAVCQFLTVAMDRWKRVITDILMDMPDINTVYERSDTNARAREGLEVADGLLAGKPLPTQFLMTEYGLNLWVDIANGHKTGCYLDQRENRRAFPIDLHGKSVLNCFCYTGGFGLRAASLGASSVTQVDSSENALEMARKNADANHLDENVFSYEKADVFQYLRTCRDSRKSFDLIVLDPPKLIETQAQLEKGCRGYKDLNLLALKLLNPGGALLTFSCSGAMTPELFQKVVGDAARDAGKSPRVARILQQAPDHPLSLDIPEADYLTGLELLL